MMTPSRLSIFAMVVATACLPAAGGPGAAQAAPAAPVPATQPAAAAPFYGLYGWCSDIAENRWLMDRLKEVGFRFISSCLGDEEHTAEGMLLCAKNGIRVAGIVGPNRYAKTMDLDGWRAEVKKEVDRYAPGGTFWTEHPDVPANPIVHWCITSEPGTELSPPGEMMPDEAYFLFLQAAHEIIKGRSKDLQIVAMSPIGGYAAVPSMNFVDKERKIMGPAALIQGVHKRGGAKLYDVLDMHAFTFPMPPDTGGNAALVQWCKEETRKEGGQKPIWFLDWGFATAYGLKSPFHTTKDQTADYAVRGLLLAARHGVQCITYTYWGDQFSATGQVGGYRFKGYGMFSAEGKLRPLAKSIKLMIGLIPDRPQLLEVLWDGNNVSPAPARSSDRPYADSPFYCYKFRGQGNDEVIAAWTEGRPFKYTFKVKADKVALYNRELLGGVVYSKDKDFGSISEKGEIVLPVTGTPLFLSNRVSPEQEASTILYLKPPNYRDWKPIAGAED